MKTTHTPGPWKIHEGWIVGPDFETVADPRCIPPTGENMRTMDANAALIAAAPDLLAACKAVEDAWTGGESGDWRGALDLALGMARAAIAKARGA